MSIELTNIHSSTKEIVYKLTKKGSSIFIFKKCKITQY